MQAEAATGDLELLNHFSLLIYPFRHDLTAGNWQTRAEALAPRWAPWWARLTDEERATALDDSSFFLPYIRGLLFPETARLQGEPMGLAYANWVRVLGSRVGKGLGAFCAELRPGSVLRLTCQPSLRAALAEFIVVQHREEDGQVVEHEEIAARLEWLDALLFPTGVGFLLLKVRLRADSPRLSGLIDLNHCLRTVLPLNLSWVLPTLHFPGAAQPLRMADLVNLLAQGLAGPPAGPLTDGVAELLSGGGRGDRPYTETEAGQAYGERCQSLTYACVHLGEAERGALPTGSFACAEDRLLFEVGACIGPGDSVSDPVWVPAPQYARRLVRENRLAVWRCWRALGLKDSFVFLATEDLPFTRGVLPHNIENDYLPLYLFALYQKFQLFAFSGEFMSEVARVRRNLRGVRALMDRFVNFRNQFWFDEVTRKALGGELYRTMRQGLEVAGLYQLVTSSVREARDYFQQLHDRRVQLGVTLLSVVFGPLVVLFAGVRVFLEGDAPSWLKAGLLALAGVSAVVAGLFSLQVWCRRRAGRHRRLHT